MEKLEFAEYLPGFILLTVDGFALSTGQYLDTPG